MAQSTWNVVTLRIPCPHAGMDANSDCFPERILVEITKLRSLAIRMDAASGSCAAALRSGRFVLGRGCLADAVLTPLGCRRRGAHGRIPWAVPEW